MTDTQPTQAPEQGLHRQRDGSVDDQRTDTADNRRDTPDPERGDAIDPDRATTPAAPTEQRPVSRATAPVPPGPAAVPPPAGPATQTQPGSQQPTAGEPATPGARATEPGSSGQPQAAPTRPSGAERASMLGQDRSARYQEQWRELQASFVDNPSTAVRSADKLVSEVVASLSEALAEQQRSLGAEWRDVPDSATEDLRAAMVRYRAVFQRLISV